MHKAALAPIFAMVAVVVIYARLDGDSDLATRPTAPKVAKPAPKPFRPEWKPSPGPNRILQGELTEEICITPNCRGCALDKDTLFRKKPGHPKYQ